MAEAKNRSQRLLQNTAYLYIRMLFVMGVGLFTSRIVLNALGFEDFGIYNVVGSIVGLTTFLQAALRNATFRYIAYELGHNDLRRLRTIYSMAIKSHAILAVILFVVIEAVGLWMLNYKLEIPQERMPAANWVFQFSVASCCISILQSPYSSNIIAHEHMNFYALTSIAEVIFKLAIAYLLLISSFDKLIFFSFLHFLISFLMYVWYQIYCRWKFKDCIYVGGWERNVLWKFSSYSGWSLLVNAATALRSQSINIFFNLFLGLLANAAMGVANQVVWSLNGFVSNFTQSYRPQLIKSWAENDKTYFMKIVFSASKISYFLLLVISIPVMANVDFLLKIWLGNPPSLAGVFIMAIMLYYLVDVLQEPLVVSVHATGKLKYHQIMIASIMTSVIVIAYFMLRAGFSGTSVLLINALSNIICGIARTLYMKKLINLDLNAYLRKVILPVILVTVLATPLPFYLSHFSTPTWSSVIAITLGSVALTASLCFVLGLNSDEKRVILALPIIRKISFKTSK